MKITNVPIVIRHIPLFDTLDDIIKDYELCEFDTLFKICPYIFWIENTFLESYPPYKIWFFVLKNNDYNDLPD